MTQRQTAIVFRALRFILTRMCEPNNNDIGARDVLAEVEGGITPGMPILDRLPEGVENVGRAEIEGRLQGGE